MSTSKLLGNDYPIGASDMAVAYWGSAIHMADSQESFTLVGYRKPSVRLLLRGWFVGRVAGPGTLRRSECAKRRKVRYWDITVYDPYGRTLANVADKDIVTGSDGAVGRSRFDTSIESVIVGLSTVGVR